jgi:hypothetical protein
LNISLRLSGWIVATAPVLCLALDPAVVGRVADGRQMIFTAVALVESGSIGQARNRDLTMPRAVGDSVSRYGLGMSLAQVPAAAVAPLVERSNGPESSQWVFLVAPFLLVVTSGAIAARAAMMLGGESVAAESAWLLATIASPFGVYVALELSEPLQALALVGGFAAALRARTATRSSAYGYLAGVSVGLAVVTKSSLILVAPLTLLPMLASPRLPARRLLGCAVVGASPLMALWLYFEVTRFGRPFGGYLGEGFTHPFFDGAWRLLVGPNKGLFFYYPAAIVAIAAAVAAWRRDRTRALLFAGAVLPLAGLLALAAPWWAWHGVDGWGPRLLIPAVPLLAAVCGTVVSSWRPAWRIALIAACVLVNIPPLLQHPTTVVRYMWACAWPVAEAVEAARVPPFARREFDGHTVIPPDQVLARVPAASPFVVLPWFSRAVHAGGDAMAARLNAPPWLSSRPDIRPVPALSQADAAALAHQSFGVYDAALVDQILRAQQLRDADRALALTSKLESIAPSGFADALLFECYRMLGRKQDAIEWLTHLPIERRQHAAINVVLALWDRDEGKADEARALLETSAGAYPPESPVRRALDQPLSAWPPDFASMITDPGVAIR